MADIIFDESELIGVANIDSPEEVDQDDDDGVSELIGRVGNRPALYHPQLDDHKDRNVVSKLWAEVVKDLEVDLGENVPVNGKTCKAKWKKLRDYYYKKKKSMKGKSGDKKRKKKLWIHFKQIDGFLHFCPYENSNTKSNLDEEIPEVEVRATDDAGSETVETDGNGTEATSTRNQDDSDLTTASHGGTPRTSGFRLNKRRCPNQEQVMTDKLLELLESNGKDEDEYFHYAMSVAAKLRSFPKQKASAAQLQISQILHQIEFDE